MNKIINSTLRDIYDMLFCCYGPQLWWPAEEPFEVMVGAVLTQSATWTNVEKAIKNLKKTGTLNPSALRSISLEELAALVHSCGYFNMKARKLKALAEWFGQRYQDDLETMKRTDTTLLRQELLGVYGVGEETADSILLYACIKPVFVIDAYTRRIIDRFGIKIQHSQYGDYQTFFMSNLPPDAKLYNEYHALLVVLGKHCCLKNSPLCSKCCLSPVCEKK